MLQEAVSAWPIIPFSVVGLFVLIAISGLIAMLYDAGARDSGRMSQIGAVLLGIGISGCFGIGLWNLTVSAAKFVSHQSVYAAGAPVQE